MITSLNDYQRGQLNGSNDAISTLAFSQDQTLDEVGNWTSFNQDNTGDGTNNLVQTRTNNKANEITGITNTTGGAWSDPTYDLVGNTTKTPSVEAPTDSGKDRQLAYDAWNRVVKVTDSSTSGFDPNTLAFYEYDARGFRVTNQRYSGVGTAADWLTHYYYTAGWQCIEERVVDLTITPTPIAQLSVQYVWGLRYVDDLIQRQRDTTGNGVLDETLYAIADRQFNVVALTDTSQTIVQRMSYTPYGEVSFLTSAYASSTNTKEWEQLFQGLRLDQSTLYDNRMRVLDALTGRFVQNDPLDYPDGMNRYAAYHVMWGGVDAIGLKAMTCSWAFRTEFSDDWEPLMLLPGKNVGGGQAGMVLYTVEAIMISLMRALWKCCDANDKEFYSWGRLGSRIGSTTLAERFSYEALEYRVPIPFTAPYNTNGTLPISLDLTLWWAKGTPVKKEKAKLEIAARKSSVEVFAVSDIEDMIPTGYQFVLFSQCSCDKNSRKPPLPRWPQLNYNVYIPEHP